jgi:hypothetical protein
MSPTESDSPRARKHSTIIHLLILGLGVSLSLALFPQVAQAQDALPPWVDNLLFHDSAITADPTLTAPEAQGLGLKFELLFSMMNDQDPQNPDNDTISVVTTPGTFANPGAIGAAVRNMLPNAKIETLTNMINIKYFFVSPRTCQGDSPRFQLLIDPGDGTGPHNAFGHIGDKPFGGGCTMDAWVFEDMTDAVPKWDLSQFAGSGAFCTAANPMLCTWRQVVAFFDAVHPNHQVLSGGVFDDSCSVSLSFTPTFAPLSCGTAFYDLITIENRTLENRQDTVQGPTH